MLKAYVVMGVSGCGKSTIGQALAAYLDCLFYDGDDFHPPENVAKMAAGEPLNDDDRYPWLMNLHELLAGHVGRGETVVIACSALKKKYRDQLRGKLDAIAFIFLRGDFDLIWQRMQARKDHYMKANMLQSQFHTLEEPAAEEAIIIDIDVSPSKIMEQIIQTIEQEA